jgi:hypothetical protein
LSSFISLKLIKTRWKGRRNEWRKWRGRSGKKRMKSPYKRSFFTFQLNFLNQKIMGMTRKEMMHCADLREFSDIVIGKKNLSNLVGFQPLNKW